MQALSNHNLFSPSNIKCTEVNKFPNAIPQKNVTNGVRNAFRILRSLEHSIRKSSKYEEQLLQCKAGHSHSHEINTLWDSDTSDEKNLKYSNGAGKSCNEVDLTESWSIMSVVCLQHQYEKLSKRYEALSREYDERCKAVATRDVALSCLRQQLECSRSQLAHAHNTLLTIGDMYLVLRNKRNMQKSLYNEKINYMKGVFRYVMEEAERGRLEFDARLSEYMTKVRESTTAQLLNEMRRCNLLFLENLRLKAQLREMTPGHVNSNK